MTMKLAATTDAKAIRDLSALCMAEPNFDIYPMSPMSLAMYQEQAADQQWALCVRTGKTVGVIWTAPSLLYPPQDTFLVMAFYTLPTLAETVRRSVGLEMIIWEAKRRIAHGYKHCEFMLPAVNAKVIAFANWVEPTPFQSQVAGVDPVTQVPHYYRKVWDLADVLAKIVVLTP